MGGGGGYGGGGGGGGYGGGMGGGNDRQLYISNVGLENSDRQDRWHD